MRVLYAIDEWIVDSLTGQKDQPAVKAALDAWFAEVGRAAWTSTADVKRLYATANRPEERLEAAEALRTLIEKVVLTPGPNRGEIDAMLYGELGTILNWIERQAIGKAEKRNTPGAMLTGVSVSVVAGAGLVLKLQKSQVENKAGLCGCFSALFFACA